MTPQELLNMAADVIAERGHNKRFYSDSETGGVCAYGALTLAATGRISDYAELGRSDVLYRQKSLIDRAAMLLARHVNPDYPVQSPNEFCIVTQYNDRPTTDRPTMVRTMKEAATMADIGEESPKVVEFEPMPETAPAPEPSVTPAPAEPVPA